MMQINFQGQITKKDYRKALEMHASQSKWLKWIFGLAFVIILVSSIVAVIRDPSKLQLSYLYIVFLLILLSYPWWNIYLQAAAYDRKGNIYQTPINGFIDDTGIFVNGPETKSSFLWTAYTHYKKTKDMVLLYQGKSGFNIFTAGLFSSEEDWKRFLGEIEVKISKVNN